MSRTHHHHAARHNETLPSQKQRIYLNGWTPPVGFPPERKAWKATGSDGLFVIMSPSDRVIYYQRSQNGPGVSPQQ